MTHKRLRVAIIVLVLMLVQLGRSPTTRAMILVVNTPNDLGGAGCLITPQCSLRQAISVANSTPTADTIIIPSGVYTLTITGHSEDGNATGDLDILASGGDLTITGAGAGHTIIKGLGIVMDADRVLHIDPTGAGGITVNISGVTIRNGNHYTSLPYGGGIYANGDNTVNITNCTISHNRVSIVGLSGRGGGIYNESGVVNITGSTLSENQVIVGSDDAAFGGAIYTNWGTLNITASTIANNTVTTVGGAGNQMYGGGIYSWFSTVNITDTVISENRTTASGSDSFYGRGGGIYTAYSTVSITDGSILSGNQAGNGGSIYGDTGTVTISGSSIYSNTAAHDSGGGIYVYFGTVNVVAGTIISNNTAAIRGGGIYNDSGGTMMVTDSLIVANTASIEGGSVYTNRDTAGTATVTGSCIVGNSDTSFFNNQVAQQTATGNWWGAATGPNTPGADTVDGNVNTNGYLTAPPTFCLYHHTHLPLVQKGSP